MAFEGLTTEEVARYLAPTCSHIQIQSIYQLQKQESIATQVRLCRGSSLSLRKQLRLKQRFLRTDRMQQFGLDFLADVISIKELDSILAQLHTAPPALKVRGKTVLLRKAKKSAFDQPLHQNLDVAPASNFVHYTSESECDPPETILSGMRISEQEFGYSFRQLVPSLLEGMTYGDLQIAIPLFARIIWPPKVEGSEVTWTLSGDGKILNKADIWGIRFQHRTERVVEFVNPKRVKVPAGLPLVHVPMTFDELRRDDGVAIRLIHPSLGCLIDQSAPQLFPTASLPAEISLLRGFKAWELIGSFISDPASNPKAFDAVIHWLFSALGWHCYPLSFFKSGELLAGEDKHQTRYSSDMVVVAVPSQASVMPVLLSLTTSLKDIDEKLQAIKNTSNRLQHKLGIPTRYGVIVSDNIDEIQMAKQGQPLVGQADLKEVWQLLLNQDVNGANRTLCARLGIG